MAQKALAVEVCSRAGRVAIRGTINVCISETVMPAAASTLMIAPLRGAACVELMDLLRIPHHMHHAYSV
ncbi:hypothetical protein GCM10022419_117510 [Nonomuraea rosea]|uniref:Uncharacterized protein n=1 Tax=Nonomuraea rosea TaxID=638574 RepID=A0ABP6ZN37_9ACTN